MRRFSIVLIAAMGLGIASQAIGDSFCESFDNGSNTGHWSISSSDQILQNGGNPGAYLSSPYWSTGVPWVRTNDSGTVFTGNYALRNVTAIRIDILINSPDFPHPCAITLKEDNDTPEDHTDDCIAYRMIGDLPLPGDGWSTYEIGIPSNSVFLPPGWRIATLYPGAPTPSWPELMNDVDELGFYLGDPEMFYFEVIWNVGIDNPTIVFDEPVATTHKTLTDVKNLFR